MTDKQKETAAVVGLIAILWLWPKGKASGKTGYIEISDLGQSLSSLFSYYDVVQSNIADKYDIVQQYENIPDSVFIAAKYLTDEVIMPAFGWWYVPEEQGGQGYGNRVSMAVNNWWRSQALLDKMIELYEAGEPGIYSPSPNSTHTTGGTGDFDFFVDGENRNDLFMRSLLSINAPFDRVIMEHGTIERPNVLHIEIDPDKSLSEQRQKIGFMNNNGNIDWMTMEEAQNIYL